MVPQALLFSFVLALSRKLLQFFFVLKIAVENYQGHFFGKNMKKIEKVQQMASPFVDGANFLKLFQYSLQLFKKIGPGSFLQPDKRTLGEISVKSRKQGVRS